MNSIFGDSFRTVRPYQLMCLICSLGDEDGEPCYPGQCELLEKIRSDPGMPIALISHHRFMRRSSRNSK